MTDALDDLRAYAQLRANLPTLIQAARAQGETWETIAATLNMSRAGTIKASHKHAPPTR